MSDQMTIPTPGDTLAVDKMPGHWLLARLGKRVLRPGGREMTNTLLGRLRITKGDDVVELAPGMGATAQQILEQSPSTYIGVERDPDAVATVTQLLQTDRHRCVEGTSQKTGLEDESADVVMGEAFLTMQSNENKALSVAEAFRVLRPGGRYGLHEMCLQPNGLDGALQDEVRGDLSRTIRVGARPLTAGEWSDLLRAAGFEIREEIVVGMLLLQPKRLVDDEGLAGALRIAGNVLRSPAARKRVLAMRATFKKHSEHIGAIAIVATKPQMPSTIS